MADKPTTPEVRASYSKHEKNQLPDVSFFQECVPYQGVYDSNNKKMSGWWQLKYFFYVQPENWGR